jgi:hypothetical protein
LRSMRLPFGWRLPSSSLAAMVATYAVGVAFVAFVTGYGIHRVAAAVIGEYAQPAKPAASAAVNASASKPQIATQVPGQQTIVREARMTLTQDRLFRSPGATYGYYRPTGAQFGSSSRGYSRPGGFFDGLFEDDEAPRSSTYRTVCVRLCDGYYFPISFSAQPSRFEHDRQVCENSCGTQGRLFTYRNPGGQIEDMQDLQGRSYRQLRTAFLYRTEYVSDCKCQARPWEEQAQDRHRAYALATAKRKGDKAAAAELTALEAKMRLSSGASSRSGKTADLSGPAANYRPLPTQPAAEQGSSDAELMRLGREARRAARARQEARRQRYERDED